MATGTLFVKTMTRHLEEEPKPPYTTVSSVGTHPRKQRFVNYEAYGKTHEYFPAISKEEYGKQSFKRMFKKMLRWEGWRCCPLWSKMKDECQEIEALRNSLTNNKPYWHVPAAIPAECFTVLVPFYCFIFADAPVYFLYLEPVVYYQFIIVLCHYSCFAYAAAGNDTICKISPNLTMLPGQNPCNTGSRYTVHTVKFWLDHYCRDDAP